MRATVRLVALGATTPQDLLAEVLLLRARPEQEQWSGAAAATYPVAAVNPDRTPFAVLAADGDGGPERPVGFGVLDRVGYLAELVDAPERAVLLRAFYLDAAAQGRGLGTAAVRALGPFARGLAPDRELLVLTVNVDNPVAQRAYRRGGFVDTGVRYLGGHAGPQLVLVTALAAPAATSGGAQERAAAGRR